MADDWRNHLPEGVELLTDTGDGLQINIPMPTVDQGLIVVRCPADHEHRFGIHLQFEGASADVVYCVSCGRQAGADEFLTDDTRRVIQEYGHAIAGRHAIEQLSAQGCDVRPHPPPQTFYSYEQEPTRRTMECAAAAKPQRT